MGRGLPFKKGGSRVSTQSYLALDTGSKNHSFVHGPEQPPVPPGPESAHLGSLPGAIPLYFCMWWPTGSSLFVQGPKLQSQVLWVQSRFSCHAKYYFAGTESHLTSLVSSADHNTLTCRSRWGAHSSRRVLSTCAQPTAVCSTTVCQALVWAPGAAADTTEHSCSG